MKSCAIIDLDSTVVNTFGTENNWSFVAHETRPGVKKRIYDIKVNGNFMWGTRRPFHKEFLNACLKYFDIVGVWSAGSAPYVKEIVEEVFEQRPYFVWSKNDCTVGFLEEGYLRVRQKPLSKLFEEYPMIDPNRTLIFDDVESVCEQDSLLHVHVPPWHGDLETLYLEDTHLQSLSKWIATKIPNSQDYKTIPLKGAFS